MLRLIKGAPQNIVYVLLGVDLALFTYLALQGLTFNLEGSRVLFEVFSSHSFVFENARFRFVGGLFQLPGILALKTISANFAPVAGIRLLSLSYVLHPFLSILASALILRRKNLSAHLVVPILSLALLQHILLLNPVSEVSIAVSLFWPLFFLTCHYDRTWKTLLSIFVLSLMLAFSHESSVIFFTILMLATFWLAQKKSARDIRVLQTVFLLSMLPALFVLVVRLPLQKIPIFDNAFVFSPSFYRIACYLLFFFVLFYLVIPTNSFLVSIIKDRHLLLLALVFVTIGTFSNSASTLADSFRAQFYVVPFVSLFAAAYLPIAFRKKEVPVDFRYLWQVSSILLCMSMVAGSSAAGNLFKDFQRFRDFNESHPGCNFVSDPKTIFSGKQSINASFAPYLSLIQQESYQPKSITFVKDAVAGPYKKQNWITDENPCLNYSKEWDSFVIARVPFASIDIRKFLLLPMKGRFDLSEIFSGIEKSHYP